MVKIVVFVGIIVINSLNKSHAIARRGKIKCGIGIKVKHPDEAIQEEPFLDCFVIR